MTRALLVAVMALPVALGASAQEPAAPRGGMVELGWFEHRVSQNFGNWHGVRLRSVLPAGTRHVFYLEAVGQEAFRDNGGYASAAYQVALGDRWISSVGVGGGTGEFFFPDLRVDASLTRKLLPSRRLLATIGGTLVRSKDVYRDQAAQASLTGYLSATAVVEAGARLNRSTPGDVTSRRGFVAMTLGRAGSRYLVVRGATGTEGYQLTGSGATERKFTSSEAAISWREWLGTRLGFVVGGEWYDNPFYTRTGVQLGLFAGW